jgi:hypothetical protein
VAFSYTTASKRNLLNDKVRPLTNKNQLILSKKDYYKNNLLIKIEEKTIEVLLNGNIIGSSIDSLIVEEKNIQKTHIKCLFNASTQSIQIDHYPPGTLQLFMYHTNNCVYIFNNPLSFLIHSPKASFTPKYMHSFLSSGYFWSKECFTKDLCFIDSGETIKISYKKKLNIQKQKNYTHLFKKSALTKDCLQEKGMAMLDNVFKRYTKLSNAITLSGGYDSRFILGYLQEEYGNNIKTFTWGDINKQDLINSDLAIAKELAKNNTTPLQIYDTGKQFSIELMDSFIDKTNGLTDSVFHYLDNFKYIDTIGAQTQLPIFRGDEILGWNEDTQSEFDCRRTLEINAFENIQGYASIFSKDFYNELCSQSKQDWISTKNEYATLFSQKNPNDIKDSLYFHIRLNHQLSSLRRIKLQSFDELNPLLSDEALNFISTVPPELRINKSLFKSIAQQRFPVLFQTKICTENSELNYETIIKKHVNEIETYLFSDPELNIYFNPKGLRSLLNRIRSNATLSSRLFTKLSSKLKRKLFNKQTQILNEITILNRILLFTIIKNKCNS